MCRSISFKLTNRRQTEVWPQGTDDVVRVVRLVRVPDEANGDDLGGVHQDLSDPDPLATSALGGRRRTALEKKRSIANSRNSWGAFAKHLLMHLLDSYEVPLSIWPLAVAPQTTRACAGASVD